MSRIKSTDSIRLSNGDVMRAKEALDSGRCEFRFVERFRGSSKGNPRPAWFLDEVGTTAGWEVSPLWASGKLKA